MRRFVAVAVLLLTGCEGQIGLSIDSQSNAAASSKAESKPANYSIICVESNPQGYVLLEVRNRRTGKCHLVMRHTTFANSQPDNSESMVKLEEWDIVTPKPDARGGDQ